MRFYHVLCLVAVTLLLSLTSVESATKFVVDVDSLAEPGLPSNATYVLYPGVEGVEPGDLLFREFASYVDRALRHSGFTPAEKPEDVDLAIFVNYGIGEPQTTTYSYSYPIFGQTGGGTSTFSGYTYGSGGSSYTTGVSFPVK